MKAAFLLGVGLLLGAVCCVNSVSSLVNPDGIESGLVEVNPLAASTTFAISRSDSGIVNVSYLGIALVRMLSEHRPHSHIEKCDIYR